ncbi:MAG: intradiol ring-cleavage dioxygenase [Burkholderiaceae bacterium]
MHHEHDHDLGLAHDLEQLGKSLLQRRRALLWLAGAGAAPLLACGGGGSDSDAVTTATIGGTTTTTGTTNCSVIPEETAGPYPGDGSNTANGSIANALALSGIVRSDIRSSVAGASGTAAGVPMTVTLTLVNTNASCAGLAGYAIYLWHCDRDGKYSMYSSGVTDQNYLRGVQATDANGKVTFTTIFPACYSGRMPHMHLEVYRSLATATSSTSKIKTSQIAFPVADCKTVYASTGYSQSVSNLAQISFATDNVFSDGTTLEMATVTGSVAAGYTASLAVGISA